MSVQNTSSKPATTNNNNPREDGHDAWVLPVDVALPKETVMSYFLEHYQSVYGKRSLAKNSPETKRIREAYWSLFACVALDICEDTDHLLLFPEDDRNDVSFLSENNTGSVRARANYMEFDVKEYTQHSSASGFNDFVEKSIKPDLHLYGLIVGIHHDINGIDISDLFFEENTRGIILVHSSSMDPNDPLQARVTFLLGNSVVIDRNINLKEYIERTDERIVMKNTLRGLPR